MRSNAHYSCMINYVQQKNPESLHFKRQFWRLAARHLPHHALLAMNQRLRLGILDALLSKSRDTMLSTADVKPYPQKRLKEYEVAVHDTLLWHGTGRLQHGNKGVVDTLDAIVRAGELRPAKDVYAVLLDGSEMVSLSTTPLRIIARSYADMHGKGDREEHRYGTALWWVAYFYSLFYATIFTRYSPAVLRNWSKWHTAATDSKGERSWGKKVNATSHSVWSAFGQGSDIEGNYPVLFGIKKHSDAAPLPRAMQQVETRLLTPVRIADLSHIEVPEDKVTEVKELFAKNRFTTPVFPIELGEYRASKQPFASLLGR